MTPEAFRNLRAVYIAAVLALFGCESDTNRPRKGTPIAPKSVSANTNADVCIARCHRAGLIVVQWDGRQPWNNGHANNGALGCVCGEVPR